MKRPSQSSPATARRRRVPLTLALLLGALLACAPAPDAAAADDCERHALSRCPLCEPAWVDELGPCVEHGVPEALCTRCRPDLRPAFELERDWCGGHGVPESQCGLCNEGILWDATASGRATAAPAEQDPARPAGPAAASVEVLAVPRSARAPAATCATDGSLIRFATDGVAEAAGLELARVTRAPLSVALDLNAALRFDARAHARLAARGAGVVRELLVDLGQQVQPGQALLVVDSPAVGAARAAVRQARARVALWQANVEREDELLPKGLTTAGAALAARAGLDGSRIELDAALQALALLGVDDGAVTGAVEAGDDAAADGDGDAGLVVRAPFAGEVVALHTALGEPVDPTRVLVEIADTSRLWADLAVPPDQSGLVALGQVVELRGLGAADAPVSGRVTWIAPTVDPATRSVTARAVCDDADGRLRAGAFASARLITRQGEAALLVPRDAVQWEGCCNVAFVRRSAREYTPRKLRLGHTTGAFVEVLEGLDEGDTVVTTGSYLLRTELDKSSIGAGCCEVEPIGG